MIIFKNFLSANSLCSGVGYMFQYGLSSDSECVRHLNERIIEHTGISSLTKKEVKPKSS